MNSRMVALAMAALAVFVSAGVWWWSRTASPESRASREPSGNPYALPDSLVETATDTLGSASPLAPTSSDSVPLPHPQVLVGTWHHGDGRSQYGDSLVLILAADGTARANERHYTLDKTGWHLARLERTGTWLVQYRGNRRPQLCTRWATPQELDACAPIRLAEDSLVNLPMMEFAGRHWRKEGNGSAPGTPAPRSGRR